MISLCFKRIHFIYFIVCVNAPFCIFMDASIEDTYVLSELGTSADSFIDTVRSLDVLRSTDM